MDIASYADDNTPYMIADNVDDLITSIEQASNCLFEWFKNNLLKRNAEKYHLMGLKKNKSEIEKLLGVKFDRKLTFDDHISNIFKKVEKSLLWPELHYTRALRRNAY